jgi:choline dehydrogenase-like flavoprotein
MHLDFRNVESGARMDTDLCIIGGGAAGITIARELLGSGVRVCLVESGGFDYDANVQSLYEGESIGLSYYALSSTRLRFFGGTTNHWVGLCAPLNEIDFEVRPWVPFSGWPIARADLEPYYQRAQPILNLGPCIYDERVWRLLYREPPRLKAEKVLTQFWQFSDPVARLGHKYRSDIQKADNVQLLLNANVINIQTNATGALVEYVDLATLGGKRGRLRAKNFVLACGGLENPRLLLLSNTIAPEGIGNRHGLVGRFFMEHLHADFGQILFDNYVTLLDIYRWSRVGGHRYKPSLRIGVETQRQEQVLNSAVELWAADSAWVQAAKNLYAKLKRGEKVDDLSGAIWRIVKDLDEVASYAYRRVFEGIPPVSMVNLRSFGEQSPNPDSRVSLSPEKDALGMNRLTLDWRTTKLDKCSITLLAHTLGVELGRLKVGRVHVDNWLLEEDDGWGEKLWGGNHHMGTTRMADDPQFGVVDRHCRVHGVKNLYVAGSSVFATSGCANPTLTIVALALRLADHIKSQFT